MSTLSWLREYAERAIKQYPELKPEILDICQLALEEVTSGGSEPHEVDLAICDIQHLIEGNEEEG